MVSEARKLVDKYVSGDIEFTIMTMIEGGRREDHGGYTEEGGRKGGAWREEGRIMEAGTVESRPHSKLAPGHGIPYPQNLEVRYTREKDTHTKGTENYTTNEVEEMGEQTSASFETQWQAPLLDAPLAILVAEFAPELTKTSFTIYFLYRANLPVEVLGDWPAAGHRRGAPLWAHEDPAEAEDAVLVQLEQKFMRGEMYSMDEISNSSAKAQNVKDIIKKSNKIMVAMKPWFLM